MKDCRTDDFHTELLVDESKQNYLKYRNLQPLKTIACNRIDVEYFGYKQYAETVLFKNWDLISLEGSTSITKTCSISSFPESTPSPLPVRKLFP